MSRLVQIGIIVLAFAWFPHSLDRCHTLGYDFNHYYEAARGNFENYVWSPHLAWMLRPLAWFRFDTSFALFYSLNVLCWLSFARKWPILGMLAVYPMLLALELGQMAPILAWLCLSFPGALLAGAWKPYLFAFAFLHAVAGSYRIRRARRGNLGSDIL